MTRFAEYLADRYKSIYMYTNRVARVGELEEILPFVPVLKRHPEKR